jgi:hypothetical protein
VGNAPTVRICFDFSDRDGNTGDFHIYLPWATPVETAFAFAYAAVPVLHAASDAIVTRISVKYTHVIDSHPEPASSADLQRNLLLLLRDGTNFEALTIVSPRTDLIETLGDYAGVRLNMQHPTVQAFATNYALWAIPFTNPEGDPIGELVTGGLAS